MNKSLGYRIITAGMALLAIACAAFFWKSADFTVKGTAADEISLDEGWYYLNDAGQAVEVSLPCKISAGTTLELLRDPDEAVYASAVLYTYGAVYDVEIYAGEERIFQFVDGGREINDAVRGNIVCSGTVPEANAGQGLKIIYHSSNGRYVLSGITLSTEKALVRSVLSRSLFCLIVSFVMLVLGLLVLAFDFVMLLQREHDGRILWIGLFLMICGLWCMSDSGFVHLLGGYGDFIFTLDFYLFMLMPVPLAYFVLSTEGMRQNRVLRAVPLLYGVNIIAQSLLAALGVFTFFRMLYVTHLLMLGAGVLCSLVCLLRAYRVEKRNETLLCIQALTSVGLLGILAISLYVFCGYATYQLVYQTGLLLLLSVLLHALFKEFVNSVRYRTEAIVYKRLSEQDKLTQLDNRRAFDALIEKMENASLKYENAALLFMDVNFLKKANDSFGHDFGDQLIVSAAKCIKRTFNGQGYCYRIGGDEFCAVVLNPSCTAESYLARIQAEVVRINREVSLAIPLSMACGCSFISENGERKSIGQWKSDADSRMYAEKKRIKAQRTE